MEDSFMSKNEGRGLYIFSAVKFTSYVEATFYAYPEASLSKHLSLIASLRKTSYIPYQNGSGPRRPFVGTLGDQNDGSQYFLKKGPSSYHDTCTYTQPLLSLELLLYYNEPEEP